MFVYDNDRVTCAKFCVTSQSPSRPKNVNRNFSLYSRSDSIIIGIIILNEISYFFMHSARNRLYILQKPAGPYLLKKNECRGAKLSDCSRTYVFLLQFIFRAHESRLDARFGTCSTRATPKHRQKKFTRAFVHSFIVHTSTYEYERVLKCTLFEL